MRRARLVAATAAILFGSAASAPADSGVPIPRPPDSDAPAGAPPHWLPADEWVHLHWLPFDESRLYALLHTDRPGLWSWLRDDNQTIAQLAATRGWPDPGRLAAALVAPRVTGRRTSARAAAMHAGHGGHTPHVTPAQLRARTLRVLVQGHLSQHLIFHSLHQEAGPEAAPRLFGVRDTAAFQRLRRLDIGPLRIGRAHGRTRVEIERGLHRALRRAAQRGVDGGDVSARQAAIVLQRQLRQVPRWLEEDHYNGPPQTTNGAPRYPFRPSFSAPSLSADGTMVLFDGQQPAPRLAVGFGEVNLEGRDLAAGAMVEPRDASPAARADRPCSSFDASVSGDGRVVAYEVSAGNRTFAKRYGNVAVAVADLRTGTVRRVAGGSLPGGRVETAYAPTISADGHVVAFTSVSADPLSPSGRWATRVVVVDLRTGHRTVVPRAGAYEPALSGDGRHVAFTTQTRVGGVRRLVAEVAEVRTGHTTLVSRLPDGRVATEAWSPALAADGRHVAFTAIARPGATPAVHVRNVATGRTVRVSGDAAADAATLDATGGRVAFTSRVPGASALGRPAQRIMVRDLHGGAPFQASVGAGGPLAGWAAQPQLSADGTHVAFTTDTATAPQGGPGGLQVLVRDLRAQTTTLASPTQPLSGFDAPAAPLDARGAHVCDLRPPAW